MNSEDNVEIRKSNTVYVVDRQHIKNRFWEKEKRGHD